MKILAIGTSNNRQSINRTLAAYAANLVEGADVKSLDIADYELPLYSDDRELELGQPELAKAFYQEIRQADALVISFVEHNGTYTAAYKNLFDWASRIGKTVYQDKPTVFLSTSPGGGGARSVLKQAVESAGYYGAALAGSLSVPSFNANFDSDKGVLTNELIHKQLLALMDKLATQAHTAVQADKPVAAS